MTEERNKATIKSIQRADRQRSLTRSFSRVDSHSHSQSQSGMPNESGIATAKHTPDQSGSQILNSARNLGHSASEEEFKAIDQPPPLTLAIEIEDQNPLATVMSGVGKSAKATPHSITKKREPDEEEHEMAFDRRPGVL